MSQMWLYSLMIYYHQHNTALSWQLKIKWILWNYKENSQVSCYWLKLKFVNPCSIPGYGVESTLSTSITTDSTPGYSVERILSTSIITSVTIFVALVPLIILIAIVFVCYKKKKSSKNDEPVEPVYYSAVRPVAEEVTADPTYDEISVAVKTWRDITTEPNEAYHPVSVQPNEAYQTTNIMQPNEAYQTTNITNVN